MKHKILMKHTMHQAPDLPIVCEVDLTRRTAKLHVEWADMGLIEWFLKSSLLPLINSDLEAGGIGAKFDSVAAFQIELVLAGKATFDLRLLERDFEPRQSTLVMHFKGFSDG